MDETQDEDEDDDDDDERKEGRKGANELSSWAGSRREGKDRCNDYYTVENTELRRTGRYSANGRERKRGWTETTSYIVLIISILLADEVRVRIKEGVGGFDQDGLSKPPAFFSLQADKRSQAEEDQEEDSIASTSLVLQGERKKEREKEGPVDTSTMTFFFCRFVTPPPLPRPFVSWQCTRHVDVCAESCTG